MTRAALLALLALLAPPAGAVTLALAPAPEAVSLSPAQFARSIASHGKVGMAWPGECVRLSWCEPGPCLVTPAEFASLLPSEEEPDDVSGRLPDRRVSRPDRRPAARVLPEPWSVGMARPPAGFPVLPGLASDGGASGPAPGAVSPAPVPVPAPAVLLVSALAGLFLRRAR